MLKFLSALFLWLTMITVLMSSPVDDFAFDTRVLDEDPQYIYNRTLSSESNTLQNEGDRTSETPRPPYFPITPKYSNPAILDDVDTASHPPIRGFFFTPPLPRDINFPFADKPTLRGSNSDNLFNRRPQPPIVSSKAEKERIPIKRPDLLDPADTKKKTINTPSMQKLPETFNFSKTVNSPSSTTLRNINNTLDVVGPAVKNISLSSILRLLNNKPDFGEKPRLEPELKISKIYYSVSTSNPTQPTNTPRPVIEKKFEDPPIRVLPNNDIDMDQEILNEQQVRENKNTDFNSKAVLESSVVKTMEQSKPRIRYILGLAWDVHVYLVAVLFAILAGVSMLSVIRIKSIRWLLPCGYFLAVNGLLTITGIVRCVYLFYDAYNIRNSFSQPVGRLCLDIVFPLIVCIFTIMFSFILKVVDLKAETYFVGKTNALFSLVILYAMCSVGVDLYADFTAYASSMMLLSHCFFVLMCVLLGVSYILFYKTTSRKQSSVHGTALRDPLPPSLAHAVRIMLATSLLSLLMAAVQLIEIFCVYDPLGKDRLHPWLWWAFQLSVRVLEMSICFLILWAAMQPLHRDDVRGTHSHNSASRFPLFSWSTVDTPKSGEQTYDGESIHVYSLKFGKRIYEDMLQAPVPMHLLNHGTGKRYPALESAMRSTCGTLIGHSENKSPSMLIGEKGVVRFRSIGDAALQVKESFSAMNWNQASDNHCIL